MEPGSSPAQEEIPVTTGAEAPVGGVEAKVVDQGAAETPKTEGSPASDSTKDVKPASPLDAVKAALEGKKPAAESSTAGEGKDPAKPADAKEESKAKAEEPLPFHNHPRWKEVTGENKRLKEQVPVLSEKAGRWDAIDAKFRETGLAPDDLAPLFDGGARLKAAGATSEEVGQLMAVGSALKLGDPQVVMQFAAPVFAALGLGIHRILPDDVKRQVEEGALSEDAATRLATAEQIARSERIQRQQQERSLQERDERARAEASQNVVVDAASGWEARKAATDPDWSRKEPHVVKRIRTLAALHSPRTREEAIAVCDMALEDVEDAFRAAGGARRPGVAPPAMGGATQPAVRAPKTPQEAVLAALGHA